MPGTPIPAPSIFPFEPDGGFPFSEQMTFATDVLTARNGSESRVPLVQIERLVLKWTVTAIDSGESERLLGLLWREFDNRWYIPRWSLGRPLNAVTSGVYFIGANLLDFYVGGFALVWKNSATYDLMTITAIAANTLTLSGTTTFPHLGLAGLIVFPILVGSIAYQKAIDRSNCTARVELTATIDVSGRPVEDAGVAPTMFLGYEVLPDIHSTSDPSEAWDARSTVNGGLASSALIVRPLDDYNSVTTTFGWLAVNRGEVKTMVQFIRRRRGRYLACWIPGMAADYTVAVAANAGETMLVLAGLDLFTLYTADAVRKYIGLFANGLVYPFKITNLAVDATNSHVTLSAALPVAFPVGTPVSWLRLSRLASDTVEVVTLPGMITTTAEFTFIELPKETPA